MAILHDVQLTPEVNRGVGELLRELPDKVLLEVAKNCLPGGFTKAKSVRKQLESMLEGDGHLPPWFVDLLQFFRIPTVASLSAGALDELRKPLVVLHDKAPMVLSLLLDSRPEVRKLAPEIMNTEFPEPTDAVRDNARAQYTRVINYDFLAPAGLCLAPDDRNGEIDPDEMPASDGLSGSFDDVLVKAMAEELKAVEDKYDRLKKRSDEARQREAEKQKQLKQEVKSKTGELNHLKTTYEAKLKKAQSEKAAIEAELEGLKDSLDEKIQEGVKREISTISTKWLGEARNLENFLEKADRKSDDILARVDSILKAQAEQDSRHGTRARLAARRDELKQAHQRVVHALEDAIYPVPHLKELLGEVDAEMARIERRLGQPPTANPAVETLLANINRAEDWSGLDHCREAIEKLTELEVLGPDSSRRLYHGLHRKYSVLEQTHKPSVEVLDRDNGWALRGLVHRNQPGQLILDGHNILFGLTDIFESLYEGDHPGEEARNHLVALTRKLIAPHDQVRTTLCFDGPRQETFQVLDHFSYEFSGGVGDDRADDAIVERLKRRSLAELDRKVFVVTDDRGLRSRVLERGAKFVPLGVFAVLLDDFGCLE